MVPVVFVFMSGVIPIICVAELDGYLLYPMVQFADGNAYPNHRSLNDRQRETEIQTMGKPLRTPITNSDSIRELAEF
ncbi:MAG: hypothetical protein O3B01_22730 [Planctomycetota bacterium]|nr:hypothetical protein [Planctomycetota bacterium]